MQKMFCMKFCDGENGFHKLCFDCISGSIQFQFHSRNMIILAVKKGFKLFGEDSDVNVKKDLGKFEVFDLTIFNNYNKESFLRWNDLFETDD